jgi:chromate transporter
MAAVAVLAFIGIWLFRLPFPLIIAAAALTGLIGGLSGLAAFRPGGGHARARDALADRDSLLGEDLPAHARPGPLWSIRMSATLLLLWLGPVAALWLALGPGNIFTDLATFFSKLAVLTFGGAYAVLAWVAQAAVDEFGWVTPGEMLDGLAMAETTPGPLIMVLQFVGFLAAWQAETGMPRWLAASLASVLVTWVTFVPCFLWIFLGAPWVERLRQNRALSGALTAITAAVVGVILNLALWFGLHVLFADLSSAELGPVAVDVPDPASLNLPALALVAVASLMMFGRGWPALPTLGLTAVLGMVWNGLA